MASSAKGDERGTPGAVHPLAGGSVLISCSSTEASGFPSGEGDRLSKYITEGDLELPLSEPLAAPFVLRVPFPGPPGPLSTRLPRTMNKRNTACSTRAGRESG